MGRSQRALSLLAFPLLVLLSPSAADDPAVAPVHHRPQLRIPPALEPLLQHVRPGRDDFPEEKEAEEIARRLEQMGAALRRAPERAASTVRELLAEDFKGTPLAPPDAAAGGDPPLAVRRAPRLPADPARDAGRFAADWTALLARFRRVDVAEFLVTRIEVENGGERAGTEVRYDVAGSEDDARRAQVVGRWHIDWRRGSDGAWRAVGWTTLEHVSSRASAPVFVEVTEDALGGNESFRRQLRHPLDSWLAVTDTVFMRDSMGHHGVSAGDADGDGLDDLYVAQPAGLPNRLYRNKGDGTFEDVTRAAGLAVLDETSHSLFADVDNDGDQDLVLLTRSGLLLLTNDGRGRFAHAPDAFQLEGKLQGTPMSLALADYDRDGFLDVYVCVYTYFIGAAEDKGGTPLPYHDARNGPPNLLLRNDGRGRFTDVTADVGLDENNDRYSFAAAWADYDEDGWLDLLVANDFGRKNLYRSQGLVDGKVRFRDVAAAVGVEDYGAGMSTAWLDYDNDGLLDIYTGNMWSAAGQRVTHLPGFMADAPEEIRDLYRRHARGNALFRNRGDGTFEDVTLESRAQFGRWAWSSDSLDFDSDGWDDLYVTNGMFTRDTPEGMEDLDGFFWRQVAARSPLTRVKGTPYEDAWRAINRLLAHRSQANHHRNVLLRNDGQGGFDDVSATAGLDLDQDGRSFALLDLDQDGDPDMAVMAARQAPQLRLFRNELPPTGARLVVRLVGSGKGSNRDAVGARVTVETDRLRRTRIVHAGSGFISQHSKDLLFGLGDSTAVVKLTVRWPGGRTQELSGIPLGRRVHLEEGGEPRLEPLRNPSPNPPRPRADEPSPEPPRATWLYEPYPAPEFTLPDPAGRRHSLADLRGRPTVLLFWYAGVPAAREALRELSRHHAALGRAGASLLAVCLDPSEDASRAEAAARDAGGVPVVLATPEVGGTYTILNRFLFVAREDLRIPTAFLLDAKGEIVKVFRDRLSGEEILGDVARIEATSAERLARATPFDGRFHWAPSQRNYLQYALELVEQGFEDPALPAFERAARGDPSPFTLYSLGTLYMKQGRPAKAKAAFERVLEIQPDFTEAANGLGALVAQSGNVPAAIALFRRALETTPDYPDALNNLGYALLQTGREREAHDLYLKALELQPDFPEAFNNLGIYFARQGEMARAQSYFRQALEKRPSYGEAGNNLALVLMAGDQVSEAVAVLTRLLEANPAFEMSYVTLSKIYLSTGRRREGLQVLERLLQRNPQHPLGLQLMKEVRGQP